MVDMLGVLLTCANPNHAGQWDPPVFSGVVSHMWDSRGVLSSPESIDGFGVDTLRSSLDPWILEKAMVSGTIWSSEAREAQGNWSGVEVSYDGVVGISGS